MDACLVIGAEETNWILADALWHLERSAILTGGAGALCLCREAEIVGGRRTGGHHRRSHLLRAPQPGANAARTMRGQLTARLLRQNCSATASAAARARMRAELRGVA